jgi:sugar lactone lactonase YvrE
MDVLEATCVLDAQALVGEGIVWCAAAGKALWVDVWGRKLHRYDPESGKNESWELPEKVGCVAPIDGTHVAVGLESGIYLFDLLSAALTPYFLISGGAIHNRCNDSVVDPAGRLWCGTMNLQGLAGPATGELYAVGPQRQGVPLLQGLHLPNGLACSPDGRTLYLSDSHPSVRTIWKFDLDLAPGRIDNRQVFMDGRELKGRPDGATVDVDGCYWTCCIDAGEVLRITPRGNIDCRVRVPVSKPSKVVIGGSRLDTLYITSIGAKLGSDGRDEALAGGLFAAYVGPIGIASPRMILNHQETRNSLCT